MQDQLTFDPDIAKNKPENIVHAADYCPFCDVPNLTNIMEQDGDRIWLMNKFRTLVDTDQTVLIESADHNGDLTNYTVAENRSLFAFLFKCWKQMAADPRFKSVAVYKNFGPLSGGSLRHPHMQLIGFEQVDIHAALMDANFVGVPVTDSTDLQVNVSTEPVMGFTEFNISIADSGENVDGFADTVQAAVDYVLHDYFGGRCKSYNLFFYHRAGELIAKLVPRFVVSPYFVGYKMAQVNKLDRIEAVAEELKRKLSGSLS